MSLSKTRLETLRDKILLKFDTVTKEELDEYINLAIESRGRKLAEDLQIIQIKLLARQVLRQAS